MSLAAFLEWDDGSDARYELVDGQIVAMAPGSQVHAALAGALTVALGTRLKPPCRVFGEGGVVPDAADDTVLVPDVLVSCAPVERKPMVEGAVLIAEVMSPSTRKHDRGEKVPRYQEMPSVRHILLVDQERRRIDHLRRTERGWEQTAHLAGAAVPLDALGIELPVDEIYAGIA